jgi:hypothetical protein
MDSEMKLLPCPFCGGVPELVNDNGDHARHEWSDCPCDGLMEPAEAWNTRTPDPAKLREALEKVKDRCFSAEGEENWAHDILSIVVPVLDAALSPSQQDKEAGR